MSISSLVTRRLSLLAALLSLCATPPVLHADDHHDQFDLITLQTSTSSQTVWRISHPNVMQAVTTYPGIHFLPGDSVSVTAAGCVQTGGHGQTWKRYVNPSGDNSDRLYHGKISIPGITNGLVRIQNAPMFNKAVTIPAPGNIPAANLVLQLGYEDDGFGDNGYWGHDDGTESQCKNSQDAFVVISIGHNGTLAANPANFTGILPDQFRCQAGWAFQNPVTPRLSQGSFDDAFNLGWTDYIDPLTEITYLAARGLASSGNCAGMSLLADVGEDQFIAGNLSESFWANYKNQATGSPSVIYDVNVAHWKQISATFLRGYIGTVFQSPTTTAQAIERDVNRRPNYTYGLVSIAHGTGGHVLVPLKVTHVGTQTHIDVYDSNYPCPQIPDNSAPRQIIVEGNKWTYDMGGSDGVWSDSSGGVTGYSGLAYIPYNGPDGWSDLGTNISGLLKVIFGGDVDVEQVTGEGGKQLYKPGTRELDRSPQGLGKGLVMIPKLAQNKFGRPRTAAPPFPMQHDAKLTPAQKAQVQANLSQYEAAYGDSGQIFLATPAVVNTLTFTLSSRTAGKPVRMTVGGGSQFFEVNSAAVGIAHPTVTLNNLKNLSEGVSVQSRDATAMKLVITHGLIAPQAQTLTLQVTSELPVSTQPARFSLDSASKLQLAGPAVAATIRTQVLDRNAKTVESPLRNITSVPNQ